MDVPRFLARNKHAIEWFHILSVIGLAFVFPVALRFSGEAVTPAALLTVFFFGTIAFSQNIGLIHEFAHRLPPGPKRLGLWTARIMHALGGLRFEHATVAHKFHHAFLGTSQDPDRNGYNHTTQGPWRRLLYLFFIGPIRAKFAPVDLSPFLSRFSPEKRANYERGCKLDLALVLTLHLSLAAILGILYLPLFTSLIFSNMLSNIREMTEHGNGGSAAYVNIKVSPWGALFLSTPGFWYHGTHHMHPDIHYLDLPSMHASVAPKQDGIPFFVRSGYLRFLLSR